MSNDTQTSFSSRSDHLIGLTERVQSLSSEAETYSQSQDRAVSETRANIDELVEQSSEAAKNSNKIVSETGMAVQEGVDGLTKVYYHNKNMCFTSVIQLCT